jgi:hypothetical protein
VTYLCPNADMGGGDIAVGQRWRGTMAYETVDSRIRSIDLKDGYAIFDEGRVSFGALLADWQYIEG